MGIEISKLLCPMTFAPMEQITWDGDFALFIIRRGIAAKLGIPMGRGAVWGLDFIMTATDLIDTMYASALTYVEVQCLTRERFLALVRLKEHAAVDKKVRYASVHYCLRARLIERGRNLLGAKATGRKRESLLVKMDRAQKQIRRRRRVWLSAEHGRR